MSALRRLAPAKINLALHIVGRRNDGYHLLESLVVFTRFGDHVTAQFADKTALKIHGPYSQNLPLDTSNLILRGHDLLRGKLSPRELQPVSFTLEKNLPIASGLGGGSSDAAAVIALLCRLWTIDMSADELDRLALSLGADVPMCIAAHPLIARGTGEQIEPVKLPSLPMVLVNAGDFLATPSVFNMLEKRNNPSLPPLGDMKNIASVIQWVQHTRNDLEEPAMRLAPSIQMTLQELTAEGAEISRMSGSGATCFGIFQTREDAEHAALNIAKRHPAWFVVATQTFASDETFNEYP